MSATVLPRKICRCGHEDRSHHQYGQICQMCDCRSFQFARSVKDRGPQISAWLKRLDDGFD